MYHTSHENPQKHCPPWVRTPSYEKYPHRWINSCSERNFGPLLMPIQHIGTNPIYEPLCQKRGLYNLTLINRFTPKSKPTLGGIIRRRGSSIMNLYVWWPYVGEAVVEGFADDAVFLVRHARLIYHSFDISLTHWFVEIRGDVACLFWVQGCMTITSVQPGVLCAHLCHAPGHTYRCVASWLSNLCSFVCRSESSMYSPPMIPQQGHLHSFNASWP